ncbi:MAG TPA: prepilin-type N-terminal cleavage/methylation domain-containing protein [Actinoplanes sp.]|nr:prepilin-type N-terminal cleavage/methylation domain-containing protein [Actinoplanes sp.]
MRTVSRLSLSAVVTGARRRGRAAPDDHGVTLVEMVVALSVMSVVLSVATAGLLQVFRTLSATEARATAQAQVHVAFARLDKQIRYAKQITTPTRVGTTWFVEFLSYRADTVTSTPEWTCTALRLRGDRLDSMSWALSDTPDQTQFRPILSTVTATDPSAGPFPPPDAIGGANHLQRLRLAVTVGAAAQSAAAARSFDVTFTALNSADAARDDDPPHTRSETVCTQERPR